MKQKSVQVAQAAEPKKQKPAVMVEMPENFSEMTDSEIETFTDGLFDDFVADQKS